MRSKIEWRDDPFRPNSGTVCRISSVALAGRDVTAKV